MFVVTIDSKSSVKQVLRRSDHSADHRQSSAAVLVLLVGFAQQLRLKVPVVLTPLCKTQRDTPSEWQNVSETERRIKRANWRLPVVENLRDLPSGLVGPIAAQAAGAKGEGHAIRALHCGHTSIAIGCAAAIVPQSNGIFHPFLQKWRLKDETVLGNKY